jgi:predicted O-methyltransferase YrrM
MAPLSLRAELDALPQGWFHHGEHILTLLELHRPKVVVELGTWRGASAIAMARVVRRWGGTVTCVDTWMGDVNGGIAPGPPSMLSECARNIVAAGVSPSIRLIPALTVEAAQWWTGPIDFLYIDADHTYASVKADLAAWTRHVRPRGLFAGDDYRNPMYPGVQQAWDEFETTTGWTVHRVDTPHTDPPGMQLVYGVVPAPLRGAL